MWLAVKKIVLAIVLPIIAFFSLSGAKPIAPPLPVTEAVQTTTSVPQPVMPQGQAIADQTSPKTALAEISASSLKDCLGKAGKSGTCLDAIFHKFLKTRTTREALAVVQHYEDTDTNLRLSCHPIVHAIGRETFLLTHTVHDSFAACDQTCHSGCYHGGMERFLRGDAASNDEAAHISIQELETKAATACDPQEALKFRFQCLHGLGHALMFFLDYQLQTALATCDKTGNSWSRSSCYGGVFMENVFSATPEKRDLSPTDYHYPCDKLDPQYRSDCYMMQTTRMTEMGLSTERLFQECRTAGKYQYTCMQSIGRDLSNDARISDPRLTAKKCELGTGPEREACTRGVAYALADNTWDGRYAFPFCDTYADPGDVSYCYRVSVGYLKGTFQKSVTDITADCATYAPTSKACPLAAAQ